VRIAGHIRQTPAHLLAGQLNLDQELIGYFNKSLLGPRHKPVDCGVVDKRGVLSAVVAEGSTNWGHKDSQVHLIFHSVVEPVDHFVRSLVRVAHLFVALKHFLSDSLQLIIHVDVRHNARIKHVLDVFKEGLLHNIVV